MFTNIVDNLEQCGQQNIVQCCFHQVRTGSSFFFCCTVDICTFFAVQQASYTLSRMNSRLRMYIYSVMHCCRKSGT